MRLAISEQAAVFIFSVLLGALLGILYDAVRVLRQTAMRRKWMGFVLDVFFIFLSCLFLLGFVLTVANGQMRWYVLLGVVLGWLLYAALLGQTVFKIMQVVCRVISKLLQLAAKPIWWFFHSGYHLLCKLVSRCRSARRKKKTHLPEDASGQM